MKDFASIVAKLACKNKHGAGSFSRQMKFAAAQHMFLCCKSTALPYKRKGDASVAF